MTIKKTQLENAVREFCSKLQELILCVQLDEIDDISMDYSLQIPKIALHTLQLMDYVEVHDDPALPEELEKIFSKTSLELGLEGEDEITLGDLQWASDMVLKGDLETPHLAFLQVLPKLARVDKKALERGNIDKFVIPYTANLVFDDAISQFTKSSSSRSEVVYEDNKRKDCR